MTMLSNLAILPSLPLTSRFISHASTPSPLSIFPYSVRSTIPLGAVCLPSTFRKIAAGALDDPMRVLDLEHAGLFGELGHVPIRDTIGSSRNLLDGEHLVTTRLRPYLKKTLSVPPGPILASPEWIPLRLNLDLIRPRFLQVILLSNGYGRLASRLSSGKQHPRIAEDTLYRIEIPSLSLEQQDAVLAELEPIINEAIAMTGTAERIEQIVDPVFHDAFGLDPIDLQRSVSPRWQSIRLTDFASNPDARLSWKYHSPEVLAARRTLGRMSQGVLAEYLMEPPSLVIRRHLNAIMKQDRADLTSLWPH